ncbi:GNAT family N-acetyltransferase [Gracilibacillus alcaliphilus]|uniref:GNAT family N-acetyltransferase n=1 Tax=Gracilibacillus alcaliphilus TaxID=1401441 RepID=UPI0019593256|nr:aminoglycoside 6'-N-acetyltransferase [Gracilibacillus alcaliphilus]
MLVEGNNISIRRLQQQDDHLLAKWLSDPDVLAFYQGRDRPLDLVKVHDEFYSQENRIKRCIIEYQCQPIGYLQFYPLDEQERQVFQLEANAVYGMDQFIGEPAFWGKGIGQTFVRMMAAYLINHESAKKVVVDPQQSNLRAIRCYEKCGFVKIKVLADHEWHEGDFRDCWLMEYTV